MFVKRLVLANSTCWHCILVVAFTILANSAYGVTVVRTGNDVKITGTANDDEIIWDHHKIGNNKFLRVRWWNLSITGNRAPDRVLYVPTPATIQKIVIRAGGGHDYIYNEDTGSNNGNLWPALGRLKVIGGAGNDNAWGTDLPNCRDVYTPGSGDDWGIGFELNIGG